MVYRLGISIEWGSKKYTSLPLWDPQKWAEICAHIIRHYNEGWCDGFYYQISYWEIWNEPENPPMWQGTMEDGGGFRKIDRRTLEAPLDREWSADRVWYFLLGDPAALASTALWPKLKTEQP